MFSLLIGKYCRVFGALLAVRVSDGDYIFSVAPFAGDGKFLEVGRYAGVNHKPPEGRPNTEYMLGDCEYCEIATKFHAAVPVSQLFFPSPGRAASLPATIWQ